MGTAAASLDYVGAYASAQPNPNQLGPPPDGFAKHTKLAAEDAVDFMIETVHRYPHEVTILEIAPPTNLALAIRKDPTIVPLIKQIVTNKRVPNTVRIPRSGPGAFSSCTTPSLVTQSRGFI